MDPNNVILSWSAGFGAISHTIFLGDDYNEVDNATEGISQNSTTYSAGTLEAEKMYYWRVDESDAIETYKGDVWTFTTSETVGKTQPQN